MRGVVSELMPALGLLVEEPPVFWRFGGVEGRSEAVMSLVLLMLPLLGR